MLGEGELAQPSSFRIFISAVSNELGSCRREVARVLRRKGLEVRDQEHFSQGPATLLERLRDYIEQCDAVVLLIGERYGAFPTDEHAAALGAVSAFEEYRSAKAQVQASYTQWEFFLARHYGKKSYVFLTAGGFSPDKPSDEAPELGVRQRAYREWIKQLGLDRRSLSTPAKLIEDVLVLDFPDLGRPRAPRLLVAYQKGVLWPTVDLSVVNAGESRVQVTGIRAVKVASVKDEIGRDRHLLGPRVSLSVDLATLRDGGSQRLFGEDQVSNLDPGEAEAFRLRIASENAASLVDLEVRCLSAGSTSEEIHRPDQILLVHSPGENEPGAIEAAERLRTLASLLGTEHFRAWAGRSYQDSGVFSLLTRSVGRLAGASTGRYFEKLRQRWEDTESWGPMLASFAEALGQGLGEDCVAEYLNIWIRDAERVQKAGMWDNESFPVTIVEQLLSLQTDPVGWIHDVLESTLQLRTVEDVVDGERLLPDDAELMRHLGRVGLSTMRTHLAEELVRRAQKPLYEFFLVWALVQQHEPVEQHHVLKALRQMIDSLPADVTRPHDSSLTELNSHDAEAANQLRLWWRTARENIADSSAWRSDAPRLARCASLVLGDATREGAEEASRSEDAVLRMAAAVAPQVSCNESLRLAADSHSGVRFALVKNSTTSTAALAQLAKDGNSVVRRWVVLHPNVDRSLLSLLATDPSAVVAQWAARRLTEIVSESE